MNSFSSLRTKINALSVIVSQNSITPAYMASLLEDFLELIEQVDSYGLKQDVIQAIDQAKSSLKSLIAENAAGIDNNAAAIAILQEKLSYLESITDDDGYAASLPALETHIDRVDSRLSRHVTDDSRHINHLAPYTFDELDDVVTAGVYDVKKLADAADPFEDYDTSDLAGEQSAMLFVSEGEKRLSESGGYDRTLTQLLVCGGKAPELRYGTLFADGSVEWEEWLSLLAQGHRGSSPIEDIYADNLHGAQGWIDRLDVDTLCVGVKATVMGDLDITDNGSLNVEGGISAGGDVALAGRLDVTGRSSMSSGIDIYYPDETLSDDINFGISFRSRGYDDDIMGRIYMHDEWLYISASKVNICDVTFNDSDIEAYNITGDSGYFDYLEVDSSIYADELSACSIEVRDCLYADEIEVDGGVKADYITTNTIRDDESNIVIGSYDPDYPNSRGRVDFLNKVTAQRGLNVAGNIELADKKGDELFKIYLDEYNDLYISEIVKDGRNIVLYTSGSIENYCESFGLYSSDDVNIEGEILRIYTTEGIEFNDAIEHRRTNAKLYTDGFGELHIESENIYLSSKIGYNIGSVNVEGETLNIYTTNGIEFYEGDASQAEMCLKSNGLCVKSNDCLYLEGFRVEVNIFDDVFAIYGDTYIETDLRVDGDLTVLGKVLSYDGFEGSLDGNASSATTVTTTLLTDEDLDDIKGNNFTSYCATSANTCTNKPSGVTSFLVTVNRVPGGLICQTLQDYAGNVYHRFKTGPNWNSWKRLLTGNDFNALEARVSALENK